MPCNCSKPITPSECHFLKKCLNDGRMFIYHISDQKGLMVAYVPNGENPNQIAQERGFFNNKNELEWYYIKEHPCLKNT